MPTTKDPLPGTNTTYEGAWAGTYNFLNGDAVDAPTVDETGRELTPEEYAANPRWYLKSYFKNIMSELRLLRAEHRAAVAAEVAREAELAVSIGEHLTTLVPALAAAIAEQLGDIPPADVQAAVEAGVRRVLGSLDAPG